MRPGRHGARVTRMLVVHQVSDEADDGEHSHRDQDGRAAPGGDHDARHEDECVNGGLKRRRRLFLSDRGDDENVDDQQDQESA